PSSSPTATGDRPTWTAISPATGCTSASGGSDSMKRLSLLVAALAALTAVAAPLHFPKKARPPSDLPALQGEWEVVRVYFHGKEHTILGGGAVVDENDRLSFVSDGERRTTWRFKLDPSREAKLMDLRMGSATMLAVYRVEKDSLVFTHEENGKGRPAALDER